jgi:predicted Holliday junction resolvase-like endonuclease
MKTDEDEGCCFGKDIVLLLKMLLTLFKIYYLRSYLQLSKQTWRLKIAQIQRHLSPERSRTIHRQEEKKRKKKREKKNRTDSVLFEQHQWIHQ